MMRCRWGNGPADLPPLARYGAFWWRARSRLAVGGQVVVPQTDGVNDSESAWAAPSIIEGRPWSTMQELTCHWNAERGDCRCAGKIVREAKVASEPAALIEWFRSSGLNLVRIGLEAGPLSQWLFAAMKEAGLSVEWGGARALALDEGVGRRGRAVCEIGELGDQRFGVEPDRLGRQRERVEHGLGAVLRRGRRLHDHHVTGIRQHHEVREGAADIGADEVAHAALSRWSCVRAARPAT